MSRNVLMKIAASSIQQGNIPFTLFTQDSEERMVLFCKKGMVVTPDHLIALNRHDRTFFIGSDEINEYLAYTFERLDALLESKDVHKLDKTKYLHDISTKVVNKILNDPESPGTVRNSELLIKSTVKMIISTPEAAVMLLEMVNRERYLLSHCIGTSVISLLIGSTMYPEDKERLNIIGLGGLLMDIGMTQISTSILEKKGPLEEEEWEIVKKHTVIGSQLLQKHKLDEEVVSVAQQHHERLDGSGYPYNLSGDKISITSRIISLADVYDAMTSPRSFRKAYNRLEALKNIALDKDKFDPEVYNVLLKVVLKDNTLIDKLALRID